MRATLRINRILANVAATRSDREIMLIDVGGRVLLAWGTHEALPPGAQRVNDISGIRHALKVKDE
jgi:hypothetical protein